MSRKYVGWVLIVCVGIISYGCSRNQKFNNDQLAWTAIDTVFAVKQPIMLISSNHKQGLLAIEKDTFSYEYSQEHALGPQTLRQEFSDAFLGNYYYKFFEYIHIEARFNRKYRDSVHILDIITLPCDPKAALYACTSCNACATLKFKDRTHQFPFVANQRTLTQTYQFQIDTIDRVELKTYYDINSLKDRGVTFTRLDKSKEFLSLWIKPVGDHSKTTLELIKSHIKLID